MAEGPLLATHGPLVDTTPSKIPDSSIPLQGTYVTLEGIKQEHTPSLWKHLDPLEHPELFVYLPWTTPTTPEELWEVIHNLVTKREFVVYAVLADLRRLNPDSSPGKSTHAEAVGIIAYLNIEPSNRALEIGAVLFSKQLQRTVAATEVHYLLMRNAAEASVPYRRICWKCNHLNHKSRRAAERLGYVFEGTFRKHMIGQGRSRDSDWLSFTDDEWPVVKEALEKWLESGNFDGEGRQVKSLDTIRGEIQRA